VVVAMSLTVWLTGRSKRRGKITRNTQYFIITCVGILLFNVFAQAARWISLQ